jgi:hypothetical protein
MIIATICVERDRRDSWSRGVCYGTHLELATLYMLMWSEAEPPFLDSNLTGAENGQVSLWRDDKLDASIKV